MLVGSPAQRCHAERLAENVNLSPPLTALQYVIVLSVLSIFLITGPV